MKRILFFVVWWAMLLLAVPCGGQTVETFTVFAPQEGDGTYNHGAVLFPFKGKLFAQWQSSAKDEDAPDTRVLVSCSSDGESWSAPATIAVSSNDTLRTSGGWWSDGHTLIAYINVWPPTEQGACKEGFVQYVTSADGAHWNTSTFNYLTTNTGEQMQGIIEQDIRALPGGRLLTAFHVPPGLTAIPCYTQDPLGISGWTRAEMKWEAASPAKNTAAASPAKNTAAASPAKNTAAASPAKNTAAASPAKNTAAASPTNSTAAASPANTPSPSPCTSRGIEPSWFLRPDGTVVMVFRDQWSSYHQLQSISTDQGESWSTPVETDFPDSRAKQSAGNLPDGTPFMVNCPSANKDRFPLVLSLSEDGITFDRQIVLRTAAELPPLVHSGKYKRSGYSYPKSVIWRKALWVIYATNKEIIQVTKVL